MLKLTVLVGVVPLLSVAVSWIVPPAVCVAVALVVIAGEALLTVLVSPASLQVVAKALLLVSPLYLAIPPYVPSTLSLPDALPILPLPLTVALPALVALPPQVVS